MLTDGVLIMQNTVDSSGVIMMNPGLHKIFETKNLQGNLTDSSPRPKPKEHAKSTTHLHSSTGGDCEGDKVHFEQEEITFNAKINSNISSQNQSSSSRKLKEMKKLMKKKRFNERKVEESFDKLLREIRFKIVYQESGFKRDRHSLET